jgi:hypothetical protein
MTLSLIRSAIAPSTRGMSFDAWVQDETTRAEKIKLFRNYVDGDHRANLTHEMRRMLRVAEGSLNEFNDNYCPVIISTMVDRLRLLRVEADNKTASDWCARVFREQRLDALQDDVHDATVRDGRTFLMADMVEQPDGTRRLRFTHEPAFDGVYGVIPYYASDADRTPLFVVKVWRQTTKTIADTTRINVYFEDRIERYVSSADSGNLLPFEVEGEDVGLHYPDRPHILKWLDSSSQPIGVPFVAFVNQGKTHTNDGKSEIEDVIPLQDVLNRTLYSMTMTAELTAFAIRVMIGDQAPAAVTPGMILSFYAKDINGNVAPPTNDTVLKWLQSIRLDQWQPGELTGFIEQAKWLKAQMFEVTSTPDEGVADSASGESLKQREIKLLGKVARFQTRNGNAWEDAFALGHRVESAFSVGAQPPAYTDLTAKWKDAQIRNKAEIIQFANEIKDQIDLRTYLTIVAEVFDWSEETINQIVAAKEIEKQRAIRDAARGFGDSVFGGRSDAETDPEANDDQADDEEDAAAA